MNGKSRCKILKEIRKQIAEHNDIEFVTSECKYQGDCLGTCPKCEAEVRYLENELKKREMLGKRVVLAGLALAVTASALGCSDPLENTDESDIPDNDDKYTETAGDPLPEVDGFVEFDGVMMPAPNISDILDTDALARNEYISAYTRFDLRAAWSNADAVLGENVDIFYVTHLDITYEIKVTYGENDVAVSVVVRETEEEFMGDMLPPLEEDDEK